MYSIHYEVMDDVTYPFPHLNGTTVEVWQYISNSTSHFIGHVINYPYSKLKLVHISKRDPCQHQKSHNYQVV